MYYPEDKVAKSSSISPVWLFFITTIFSKIGGWTLASIEFFKTGGWTLSSIKSSKLKCLPVKWPQPGQFCLNALFPVVKKKLLSNIYK